MNRKIKTKPDEDTYEGLIISGYFSGKRTYLWFGEKVDIGITKFLGTLSGQKLYRLAKAIVRQF
jgi:hypothetical protein